MSLIDRDELLAAFKAMQWGLGQVEKIPRMDVSAAIGLVEQAPEVKSSPVAPTPEPATSTPSPLSGEVR